MSQENVELHHHALDAFNRRDLSAFLALMSADVQAVSLLVAFEGDFRGHDGIRRRYANLLDAFPDWAIEVVGQRDFGDVTVANLRAGGHGADSDIPAESTNWNVAEWRDKKVIRWESSPAKPKPSKPWG